MYCSNEQERLFSLLNARDLLALRLVSPQTKLWVEAVMSKHPTKSFTFYIDENTALHELVDEDISHGIPFFRALNVKHVSFFSQPLIPSFLRTYGSQIHTVYRSNECSDVVPKELVFYQALPNLTKLSTNWLGETSPHVELPALQRLDLHSVRSELGHSAEGVNLDFLLNLPNLTHLGLSMINMREYMEALIALGPYFAMRNGLEESSRKLLCWKDPSRTPYSRVPSL
jgi:hypothetical protein